jgi:hypothetical protein
MNDLDKMENELERNVLQAYCDFTVANWSQYNGGGGRVQRWVNSTWNRWVFARLMVGTTLAPPPSVQGLTVGDISRALNVSRQGAHKLVDDCVAQGWVFGTDRYHAGPELIDYVHASAMQVHALLTSQLTEKSQKLTNYREIRANMSSQLSLTDAPNKLQSDTKEAG